MLKFRRPGSPSSGDPEAPDAGPKWEFRASARKPKKGESWVDACVTRVGRINQHTNTLFVGHKRFAVARNAAPPRLSGVSFLHVTSSRRAERHPKAKTSWLCQARSFRGCGFELSSCKPGCQPRARFLLSV